MSFLLLKNTSVSIKQATKYLGIKMNKRLTRSKKIKSKRKQANIRLHLILVILKSALQIKYF